MQIIGKFLFILLILSFRSSLLFGQIIPPTIQWQKTFGGSGTEAARSIQETSDGGYIIAGSSLSNDGDVSGNHGQYDHWIVKINNLGIIEWQKTLGGSKSDGANTIRKTTDGGYIVIGSSLSLDGNSTSNYGAEDCWVVKLRNNGTIEWQKCYGGSSSDVGADIEQTIDGGYILCVRTSSNNVDVSGYHGTGDCWIVKIDNVGNILWKKCYGGSQDDVCFDIQQTSDQGYIVVGRSNSNDGDVTGNHGGYDLWVIKLSSVGAIQWQKLFGGSGFDYATSVRQTQDGGYIIAGTTQSSDGDVIGYHGAGDFWILKINNVGLMQWQKSLGGTSWEIANSINLTSDGGFIIAGFSYSNDGDVMENKGGEDYWILKINSIGTIQWQKSLGGIRDDEPYSISQTTDGGFIIAGRTYSNDVNILNHGQQDYYIVKLTSEFVCNSASITSQPSDVTICTGSAASFTVNALGTGLIYQWQVRMNGGSSFNSISNATNSTYTIPVVIPSINGYQYRAVVSGCGTPTTSSIATLTVSPTFVVTGLPNDAFACSGSSASFSVTSTGGTGLTYQWQISTNGNASYSNITNATSSIYNIPSVTTTMNGYLYQVIVTGCGGNTLLISNAGLLTVSSSPTITSQPLSSTVCPGSPTSFSVNTTGTGLTYQWQLSTNNGSTYDSLLNARTSTYTIPAITSSMNGYRYRVVVSGCGIQITSSIATLTVSSSTPNQRYPAVNAASGIPVQLNARIITGGSYQWLPSSGLNNAAIRTPMFNYNSDQQYLVKITPASGCVITDTLKVTISKGVGIYVPKGFSPNNDGQNDYLFPILVGIKELKFFKVYNRWGQLLFETKTPGARWDGRVKGTVQPVETYTWFAEGLGIDGSIITRSGGTLLLK